MSQKQIQKDFFITRFFMASDGITKYVSNGCNNKVTAFDEIACLMIYREHLNETENGVRLNQREGALLL